MNDKLIVDAASGQSEVVPVTAADAAVREDLDARNVADEAAEEARAAAKTSAFAKLAALGLTQEEMSALLGV